MFTTKPQLADALLGRAHSLGIRTAFAAGDEVYGGPPAAPQHPPCGRVVRLLQFPRHTVIPPLWRDGATGCTWSAWCRCLV
jgi:hypothetical protein